MNKNVRTAKMLGLFLLGLALFCSSGWGMRASGAAGKLQNGVKVGNVKTLNANAWIIKTSNFGPFVWEQGNAPGGYWGGPSYNYIYAAGMWVGALDSLDSVHVAVGENCGTGGSEMRPANPYTWDYTNEATDTLARLYLSTNTADLAAWPLRDSSDNPIVRSTQDGYATYSDEDAAWAFSGESPVGIRIRQNSYAWNTGFNNNVVYFRFTIINAKTYTLRNVYAGPSLDADIGSESGTAANDRTDFDYTRNLAIQFQTDPESGWPSVGQFGCRMLGTPRNNTGDTVHVVDNQFSHDVLPDSILGMTAFKVLFLQTVASNDNERYKQLKGISWVTNTEDHYDEWGATVPGDKRFIMSSGPFDLAPGDSAIISLAILAAPDRGSLLALSDSTQAFYDSHLGVAGGRPQTATLPTPPLLLANNPNPFSNGTEIRYQVSAEGPVKLAIYDALGQRVRTVVDRRLQPGQYSARWDGRNQAGQKLSAGIYLYRLQAGDKALTKKLVLIR